MGKTKKRRLPWGFVSEVVWFCSSLFKKRRDDWLKRREKWETGNGDISMGLCAYTYESANVCVNVCAKASTLGQKTALLNHGNVTNNRSLTLTYWHGRWASLNSHGLKPKFSLKDRFRPWEYHGNISVFPIQWLEINGNRGCWCLLPQCHNNSWNSTSLSLRRLLYICWYECR